jgi:hypothetical protein
MGISTAVRICAIPFSEGSPSHILEWKHMHRNTGLIRRVFLASLGCALAGRADRLTQIVPRSMLVPSVFCARNYGEDDNPSRVPMVGDFVHDG